MNCPTCRRHLEPFLDDELAFQENLEVLAHLQACPACAELFAGAGRVRERFQTALNAEGVSPEFRKRLGAALDREMPGARLRLVLRWAAPVAAAGLLISLLSYGLEHIGPDPKASSGEVATTDEDTRPPVDPPGPPLIPVGAGPMVGRANLDMLLADLFGTAAAPPNALFFDGSGPPLSGMVGHLGNPAIEALVGDLEQDTFVARLGLAFTNATIARELNITPRLAPSGLEIGVCCRQTVLTVRRPGARAWLLVHSRPDALAPLIEFLSQR